MEKDDSALAGSPGMQRSEGGAQGDVNRVYQSLLGSGSEASYGETLERKMLSCIVCQHLHSEGEGQRIRGGFNVRLSVHNPWKENSFLPAFSASQRKSVYRKEIMHTVQLSQKLSP